MNHRKLAIFAWIMVGLLGIALSLEIFQVSCVRKQLEVKARTQGQARARTAAQKFNQELLTLEGVALQLRQELEDGRLKPAGVSARVASALGGAPESCVRLGVLFQPSTGAPGAEPFAPYAAREKGGVRVFRFDPETPYLTQAWFKAECAQAGWSERHPSGDGSSLVVDYAEPFRLPGASAGSGIVRLEVGLEGLRRLVAKAEVGSAGYGFLLSAKGVYLADPKAELVRTGRTIMQVAEEKGDPGRRFIAGQALKGQPGFAESVSGVTGQRTWVMLEPLSHGHWSLGSVFLKDELVVFPQSTKTLVVRLVSLGVGFLLALLYLAFNARSPSLARLWYFAIVGSVVITLGTATLWYFAYTLPQEVKGNDVIVMDQASLQTFVGKYGRLETGFSDIQAEIIPTGIFIENLEFIGSGQVRVTGKVWQRFRKDAPAEARAGVVFPEAISGEADPPVAREDGKGIVQFSTFKVVLNQKMVSSPNYPFDHARVRLWLRQKLLWRNELLVPDMDSYLLMVSNALPGVDREMKVMGWKVERSFFSYMLQNYNANFGMSDYAGQQNSPELLFTVTMRREFLNPFIATFLPIMAVLGLLFAAVLTISKEPEKVKATTYQCLNFLRTVVTLFFPVVLAQINLRTKIDADRLIYLEHYYFVVYAVVLLVSANSLLFALGKNELLAYEDNALPKLAFWPFLLTCFYMVSVQFLL